MAKSMKLSFTFIVISLLLCSIPHSVEGSTKKKTMRTMTRKLSKFRVYWQDKLSTPNATSIMVVQPAPNATFGTMNLIDNKLTAEIARNSTVIGRAQGLYASTSVSPQISFTMAMSFVFTNGKYNGSSLSLLGWNPAMSEVREVPVVGGSGLFRFATGYAKLETRWLNISNGDATVQYDFAVLHY